MVHYKLTYFDVRGFAEITRQLFHLGNIEFEDIRLSREEWPAIKKNYPFGQIPVLEVDNFQIPQSIAIARYVARKTGHAGKNELEQALVDSFADQYKDYFTEVKPFFMIAFGIIPATEEEVNEKRKNLLGPARDQYFNLLTVYLKKSTTGFLAGGDLTYADLLLAENVTTFRNIYTDYTKGFPEIEALVEKVQSIPLLKEYLEKRPARPF